MSSKVAVVKYVDKKCNKSHSQRFAGKGEDKDLAITFFQSYLLRLSSSTIYFHLFHFNFLVNSLLLRNDSICFLQNSSNLLLCVIHLQIKWHQFLFEGMSVIKSI